MSNLSSVGASERFSPLDMLFIFTFLGSTSATIWFSLENPCSIVIFLQLKGLESAPKYDALLSSMANLAL